jgi:hypothetical protein
MARLPEKITVRDAATGVPINGTADNVGFTSEPIEFKDVLPWAVSMWFNAAHVFAGQQPQISVEVSDDPNANIDSFDSMPGGLNVNAPNSWDDLSSTWLWMRFVYDPKGATGVGLKYMNVTQWKDE